jgi:hypothetical protein
MVGCIGRSDGQRPRRRAMLVVRPEDCSISIAEKAVGSVCSEHCQLMTGLRWFLTRYPFRSVSPLLIMLALSSRVSTNPLPRIGKAEHLYTGLGLPPWFLRS